MPAVKYSHRSWQRCTPRPHLGLSPQQAFSRRPLFPGPCLSCCFQIPSPISASLWGTPQLLLLPSTFSSLTWQYWAIFLAQLPPLFRINSSFLPALPFLFPPCHYFHGLFNGFDQCFIDHRAHICHFVNVCVQNVWGGVPVCMWAMYTFVYPCRYLQSRQQRYRSRR